VDREDLLLDVEPATDRESALWWALPVDFLREEGDFGTDSCFGTGTESNELRRAGGSVGLIVMPLPIGWLVGLVGRVGNAKCV